MTCRFRQYGSSRRLAIQAICPQVNRIFSCDVLSLLGGLRQRLLGKIPMSRIFVGAQESLVFRLAAPFSRAEAQRRQQGLGEGADRDFLPPTKWKRQKN